MNTFALKLGGLLALVLLVAPAGAQAYRFVDSGVIQVSDDTYLLTHTYSISFLNIDAKTPIVATLDYGSMSQKEYPKVGYELYGNESTLSGATVNAIVLSETAIESNQYITEERTRDTFTLVALVTFNNLQTITEDVSLAMRYLPYNYTKNGEEKAGAFNIEAPLSTRITTDTAKSGGILIDVGK